MLVSILDNVEFYHFRNSDFFQTGLPNVYMKDVHEPAIREQAVILKEQRTKERQQLSSSQPAVPREVDFLSNVTKRIVTDSFNDVPANGGEIADCQILHVERAGTGVESEKSGKTYMGSGVKCARDEKESIDEETDDVCEETGEQSEGVKNVDEHSTIWSRVAESSSDQHNSNGSDVKSKAFCVDQGSNKATDNETGVISSIRPLSQSPSSLVIRKIFAREISAACELSPTSSSYIILPTLSLSEDALINARMTQFHGDDVKESKSAEPSLPVLNPLSPKEMHVTRVAASQKSNEPAPVKLPNVTSVELCLSRSPSPVRSLSRSSQKEFLPLISKYWKRFSSVL